MSAKGQHFKYPQCTKGECHVGQVLNLVCLQPKCINKSVICGICYDEQHRNHNIKPLKIIINNSKKYLQQLTPLTLDVEKLKVSIKQTQNKLLASYQQFEKYVNQSLINIKNSINAIFIKVIDQIELKAGKSDELLLSLEQIKNKQIQYDAFVSLMQKLLAGVPMEEEDQEIQISGTEIQQAVSRIQVKVEKDLKVKQSKIKDQINALMSVLQKTAENPSIFDTKNQFKFSTELKHAGISVLSDTSVKSIQGYNYHFGLLEPSIQEKGNRACKVAFKIKQNISNWIAVGLCYKNTIVANNYNFNYSTLGHGAYLVSSNGGSWSSIDSSKNNTVNSFNYYTDDIIIIEYQPNENKITFKKKSTQQSHFLLFENKDDDELYLCVLFYYNNDEIEFLGYDDE